MAKSTPTTTILWTISQLDCKPQEDGKTDVVFTVHWQCNGTDGDYSGSVYSSTGVTLDADAPFTPYADLTQEQVLGWVWESGVDKAATEANVAGQIADQQNPKVVTPPLPWAAPAV